MEATAKEIQNQELFTELTEEESSTVSGGHYGYRRRHYGYGYGRRHYGYGYGGYYGGYYRPVSYYGYRPCYRPTAYYYY